LYIEILNLYIIDTHSETSICKEKAIDAYILLAMCCSETACRFT